MQQIAKALEDYAVLIAVAVVMLLAIVLIFYSKYSSTPEQCSFPPGVTCDSFTATPDKLVLALHNTLGQDLSVLMLQDTAGSCISAGKKITAGQSETFTFENCSHGSSGDKISTKIRLTYPANISGKITNATANGMIITTVMDKI